ncbi:MAG: efflux transporter outer membrane subunit [Burkholderiales bacterium]|nr:MAG: efflux transporter outer membrane subunit [Burkholderiales bacterium]
MTARTPLLAALSLASFLAGCAAGPEYRHPDLPLAAQFSEARAPVGRGRVVTLADHVSWWKSFDDPVLEQLVVAGLAQNLDIAQARARLEQAKAGLTGAEAALLPIGAVTASGARGQQSLEDPMGRLLSASPNFNRWGKSFAADLGVGWELDVFGGLRNERDASLADYQASAAAVAAVRLAVASHVADLYLAIRGVQARLDIALQQLQVQNELSSKVELLFQHGLASDVQVQASQAELAQARSAVPLLQAALTGALNSMDVLLGVSPGTYRERLSTSAQIPATPRFTEAGAPADLLWRRPDLMAAERKLAAANARIGEAMSEYYPKFSLSALLGSASTGSAGHLFASDSSHMSGVLGLRWRLFDFKRIDAQIAQAKGQERERLAAYKLAVLRATEEVETALSDLANREQALEALAQGEQALGRALRSADAAFSTGAASRIDVLRAQESVLRLSDARAVAQTEAARAAVSTFKALGGGWQVARPLMASR